MHIICVRIKLHSPLILCRSSHEVAEHAGYIAQGTMDGGGSRLQRRRLHEVNPCESWSPLRVSNTAQPVEGVSMPWLLRHKLAVEACGCRQITAAVGLTRLHPDRVCGCALFHA